MESGENVSIIIPIYNVEQYIEECLLSAMRQTLKQIEIICVNDGSTDDSIGIVKKYAKEDSRIRIVEKENGGLSSARNAGIDAARGEYILFLDSDDWILPETLEELYEIAAKNDLDNVYFNAEVFFDNEKIKETESGYYNYYKRKGVYEGVYTGAELGEKIMRNGDFRPSACLQMPKRAMLQKYQIRFYEGIIHEDNLFTIQSMILEGKVMFIDKSYYQRRMRSDSIVTTQKGMRNAIGYYTCMQETSIFIRDIELREEYYFEIENYLVWLKKKAIDYISGLSRQQVIEGLIGYSNEFKLNFMLHIYREAEHRRRERELQQSVEDYRNCNSYRIGRAVTAIPRKVKKVVNKYRK